MDTLRPQDLDMIGNAGLNEIRAVEIAQAIIKIARNLDVDDGHIYNTLFDAGIIKPNMANLVMNKISNLRY